MTLSHDVSTIKYIVLVLLLLLLAQTARVVYCGKTSSETRRVKVQIGGVITVDISDTNRRTRRRTDTHTQTDTITPTTSMPKIH